MEKEFNSIIHLPLLVLMGLSVLALISMLFIFIVVRIKFWKKIFCKSFFLDETRFVLS